MAASASRGIWEAAASIGCLAMILIVLIAADGRVGQRFRTIVSAPAATDLVGWESTASALSRALFEAARDQSIAHAPLLVFSGVAIVLLISMLRI